MAEDKPRPALDDPHAYVLYRYYPSQVAAIIFVVLFALTTILHIFQLVKRRTWYFIPLVVGGLFETIGFVGRVLSKDDIWALGPFIMQSLLILVAPALFAASIYIILGRVILMVDGERYSMVRQKWLTKTFVAGDVLSFLMQGSGGGIMAMGTLNSMELGEKIIIGGLFIQLIFFALFVCVAADFHRRLIKDIPIKRRYTPRSLFRKTRHTHNSSSDGPITAVISREAVHELPWKRHLYVLYAASALILVRSIFRIIEYIQGNAGYLLSNEVFLYIFDATLMFLVMVLFNWIHPSQVTDLYRKRQQAHGTVEMQQ
ncbi:RTA1 like protein-domain-containing protein, partial [Boeremia exigua]|uniref:RTA1 like protein-domain-containing protein n=1 Tax=Boeremia exigua TaxID=749465 RepID=UPI001E8E7D03